MIRAVGRLSSADDPALDGFRVRDSRPIGGNYLGLGPGQGLTFSITRASLEAEFAGEPLLAEVVAGAFGFTPQDQLIVDASGNGEEDHRTLGLLCLRLIELTGGVVHFRSSLRPEVPPGFEHVGSSDWEGLQPHFDRMVAGLPGRVVGSPFENCAGGLWVAHVADGAFLRAWLDHPRFRMIK